MGSSEADKSSKEGKETKEPKTPASQEQTSAASGPVAADWSGFQAYSPLPPHGFIASSPQAPHPYMWGVQQFMPPYGTPPHPYVAMYPHGAMYGHPAMTPGSYPYGAYALPSPTEATGHARGNVLVDGKSSDDKGKLPIKRAKPGFGSLNMINGKNNKSGKTTGASTNDVPKSAESASEGSSDGSNANSHDSSQSNSDHHQDSAEPSQIGSGGPQSSQNGRVIVPHSTGNHAMIVPIPAAAVGPTTNLNIGMDYWVGGPSSAVPAMQGNNVSSTPVQEGMIPNGSRDSVQSHLWIQDEREIKKERRKQSNRESARRSRLRKQAECEELAKRAEALNEENASLRAEVARLRSTSDQLRAQNASLKEKLGDSETRNSSHGDEDTGVLIQCSKQNDHHAEAEIDFRASK